MKTSYTFTINYFWKFWNTVKKWLKYILVQKKLHSVVLSEALQVKDVDYYNLTELVESNSNVNRGVKSLKRHLYFWRYFLLNFSCY